MALSTPALALLAQHGLHAGAIDLDNGTTLALLKDVRLVPSRRLVCQAMWQNKMVFAKLFFGQRAQDYAQRDRQGIAALQSAQILTPNILAFARVQAADAFVLVFEGIEPSQNAEVFYAQASPKARVRLIHQLVAIVAKQHQADLLQTDMYLKNFLVQPSVIYSIDGDGIRQTTHLSQSKALHNLAVLLSKVDVIELEQHLAAWLAKYAKERGWLAPPSLKMMQHRIQDARRKAATRYADHKVFRQCTDVQVTQDAKHLLAISQPFSGLTNTMTRESLDTAIDQATLLKDGNTCTVSLATFSGLALVIKRYNMKSLGHWFSRMWRPSRASISWANAHRLQLLDLPTPKPVALLETRYLGLRGKAYFISEYIDAPDLAESFKALTDRVERAALVKAVVQLCYRLYLLQISHGDLKATNIKVLAGQPVLIDLDSMQQQRYAFFANHAHAKDLQRLMQNWKDDTSLYNAFIKSFKVVYANHTLLKQANILSD
jgi:tRNA A-37 threonylcarbamoyl transferase component Bud32